MSAWEEVLFKLMIERAVKWLEIQTNAVKYGGSKLYLIGIMLNSQHGHQCINDHACGYSVSSPVILSMLAAIEK